MPPNPYAPPASPLEAPPKAVRLFSPTAIVAHVILLTPLVGVSLAATNYRRLRNTRAFVRTVAVFVPLSLFELLLAIAWTSHRVIAIFPLSLSIAWMLFEEQRPLFDKHIAGGGKQARWYVATLLWTFAFVAVLAIWQLLTPPPHGGH